MKNICEKSIVISIILLLIGVSASSAISVDNKPSISQDGSEECRDCRELSNVELVKVERLINRVEVYSKLLLVLSKYTPEIENLYNDLQNLIKSNKPEFICEMLEQIMIYLYEKHEVYVNIFNYYYENGNFIMFGIYYCIDFPFRLLVVYFGVLHEIICTNPPWP